MKRYMIISMICALLVLNVGCTRTKVNSIELSKLFVKVNGELVDINELEEELNILIKNLSIRQIEENVLKDLAIKYDIEINPPEEFLEIYNEEYLSEDINESDLSYEDIVGELYLQEVREKVFNIMKKDVKVSEKDLKERVKLDAEFLPKKEVEALHSDDFEYLLRIKDEITRNSEMKDYIEEDKIKHYSMQVGKTWEDLWKGVENLTLDSEPELISTNEGFFLVKVNRDITSQEVEGIVRDNISYEIVNKEFQSMVKENLEQSKLELVHIKK